MLKQRNARIYRPSRRNFLKGSAVAAGSLALARPYIGNAEAATPTLRLLMWQPYAIKETIDAFESTFGAKFAPTFFDGNSEAFNKLKVGGTKDFDMVMADGFWPRLYFRQGLHARAVETWRRALPVCDDPALRRNIELFMRKLVADMSKSDAL